MKIGRLVILFLVILLLVVFQSSFSQEDYTVSSNYQTRSSYQIPDSAYLGSSILFQGEFNKWNLIAGSTLPNYYVNSVSETAVLIYYLYQDGIDEFNIISKEAINQDMLYAYIFAIMPENTYIGMYPIEDLVYSDYNYTRMDIYRLDDYETDPVYQEIDRIISELPEGLSNREKVKQIHDYIILHAEYDEGAYEDSDDIERGWEASSAYSILIDGMGMCTGYSKAFFLIMRELGIPSIVVSGGAGGSHAWNLVYLDEQWYQVDLTWNDPIPDRKGKVYYGYYLKPISSGPLSEHYYNKEYESSLTLEEYTEYLEVLFPSIENTESNQ